MKKIFLSFVLIFSMTLLKAAKKDIDRINNCLIPIPLILDIYLEEGQVEKKIADEDLNFILYGISDTTSKKFIDFKEKYGVGFIIENCVVDPFSFKRARENNQMILELLNEKYGKDWQKDLPTKPIGIA